MRFAGTSRTALLILLLLGCAPAWPASDEHPLTEIVLDCSLAMKGTGPQHSARIDMAWQAIANHYLRLAEAPHPGSPPALRLAGGSPQRDNPWRPDQLVYRGNSDPLPFLPGQPLPPAPGADGLLPLTAALEAAVKDLGRRGDRSQGFILLIAAGWEGGAGNPHDLIHGNGKGAPVIHVIGLAPSAAESRQLRQLAAGNGGIYREVAGQAGLEQALDILAGSGGIRFTAISKSRVPPPDGSRLRIADRRGWYRRDFDYQDWVRRGGQIWVPAGPYDLELTCSGRSAPFPAPSISVEPGKLARSLLVLPERGQFTLQVTTPGESARRHGAIISIIDADGQPVYRLNDRDRCATRLYPGEYRARVRPYPALGHYGEESRPFRVNESDATAVYIHLPAEGRLVFEGSGPAPRIRIEERGGAEVWSGRGESSLTLPEGRYRLRVLDGSGEPVRSKRFRIRGGQDTSVGPFTS